MLEYTSTSIVSDLKFINSLRSPVSVKFEQTELNPISYGSVALPKNMYKIDLNDSMK